MSFGAGTGTVFFPRRTILVRGAVCLDFQVVLTPALLCTVTGIWPGSKKLGVLETAHEDKEGEQEENTDITTKTVVVSDTVFVDSHVHTTWYFHFSDKSACLPLNHRVM